MVQGDGKGEAELHGCWTCNGAASYGYGVHGTPFSMPQLGLNYGQYKPLQCW